MNTLRGTVMAMAACLLLVSAAGANPPSWDNQISGQKRFKVLSKFGGAAALDKETGLVWELSPAATTGLTWIEAIPHCFTRIVGGRKGWRLPTIEELASLVDPNNPGGNPDLPPGHPFTVTLAGYWSATSDARFPTTAAWFAGFSDGSVGSVTNTNLAFAWCVRGGQGHNGR